MINRVFVIIFFLSLALFACNGQQKKGNVQANDMIEGPVQRRTHVKDGQISQVVRTVFQDSKGTFWFGTQNGAFQLQGDSLVQFSKALGQSEYGVTIKGIAEGPEGTIWFAHTDGISSYKDQAITNYPELTQWNKNQVWNIAIDRLGHVWVGTIDGLFMIKDGKWVEFPLPEGQVDSTRGISSTKMVHQVFEDSKGVLWFSTNAGLFFYTDNKLTRVSEKAGIPTNYVNQVFEDSKGILWVSTKAGLYKLEHDRAINITAGKIEMDKGIGSMAEDAEGSIWFVANQHQLYKYDGKEIIEIPESKEEKRPKIFQIYCDTKDRLWFVGFGGAYRLEKGKFIHVTKNGPW